MGYVRLERIEPEANKQRYYLVIWARMLWDTWAVWRRWGRIGQRARGAQIEECATEEEALGRAAETIDRRMQHKYVVKSRST
jgi:predicted DNA-binding WGR domain protein